MYYFDADYLKQYLELKKKVKVTVDGEVLTLADVSDVSDKDQGVGYVNGNSNFFDYRDIEQIQVGPTIITLDQLQQVYGNAKPEEKPESKPKPPSPEEEEPAPDEEPPAKGNPPVQKSSYELHNVGRQLMAEYYAKYGKRRY